MLNKFCVISTPPPSTHTHTHTHPHTHTHTHVLKGQYQAQWNSQAKLNAKYMPDLHCISSFEGTSYKTLQDTASPFVFFFTLPFIYVHQRI